MKKKKDRSNSTKYIWWDAEANQEATNNDTENNDLKLNIHKPNLVV